jgi:hypothetical protein
MSAMGRAASLDARLAVSSAVVSVITGGGRLQQRWHADLAIVSATNNNVIALLNNGAGFSASSGSPFSTGQGPSAIAVGDFNGDGKPDLAITNGTDSTATILLGDNTGVFVQAPQSPLNNFNAPAALAAADVNSDGIEDLLVSNIGANRISFVH